MRNNKWFLLFLTFILGAVASFLRWLHVLGCYDLESGFYRPGIQGILLALFIVFSVIFLFRASQMALRGEHPPAEEFHDALMSQNRQFQWLLSCLAALLTLVGAILTLTGAGDEPRSALLLRILGVLGIITAISFPLLARDVRNPRATHTSCILTLLPVIFCCFWVVTVYRQHSANPVIWDFGLEILAICACTLGHYAIAGFAFVHPRPRQTLFFCCLTGFFVLPFLSGHFSTAQQLLLLGSAVELMTLAVTLHSNSLRPRPVHDVRWDETDV